MTNTRVDLAKITLTVLFIGALIFASTWILRPFLAAIIWATMIVVATWPVMLRIQVLLWNSRALAVTAMTLILLLMLIIPMAMAVGIIVQSSDQIVEWAKLAVNFRIPAPPDWIASLPFVGEKIVATWQPMINSGIHELLPNLAPQISAMARWAAAEVGSVGLLLMQFLLIIIIAAVMYASGETAAGAVRRFGRRLGGARGENTIVLAGQAIRGVALGVGVTAVAQTVLAGIGLAIAGIPFVGFFTAVMFMLCIAQLGPSLVMFPIVIWVYWSGDAGWGTFLLIWSIFVGTMDNFLRPILIKLGADLPLLLIFSGVIGGLLAFGLVGIFIGPVVLAVTYTLLGEWIDESVTDEKE